MLKFLSAARSESLNLVSMKAARIVTALTLLFQSGLAYVAAKQTLAVGLNATPETNRALLEAVPPVEYLGFDVILFGLLPMIVLGAVYGAGEYKARSMRTSLLAVNRKGVFFASKLTVISAAALLLSFASISAAIIVTHVSLGPSGLPPLALTPRVWRFIAMSALGWTLPTVLSFCIGFLSRSALPPMLFLIPQVYNAGNFLSERFPIARALPIAAANGLIAVSEKALSDNPARNLLFLSLWIACFGFLAHTRFIRGDLSGEY